MTNKTAKSGGFMVGAFVAGGIAFLAWFFIYGDGKNIRPGMEGVVKAKTIYEEVIEDFDDKRSSLQKNLKIGSEVLSEFQKAVKDAKDVHGELARVGSKWERVKEDTNYVKKEFENLVRAADSFFSEVMSRAGQIENESLRRETLSSINQKRDAYVVNLKNTRKSLLELDSVYREVNDMMIAVEVHYSMKMFDQKVDETLSIIDEVVRKAMKDLEGISEESRALLQLGS